MSIKCADLSFEETRELMFLSGWVLIGSTMSILMLGPGQLEFRGGTHE